MAIKLRTIFLEQDISEHSEHLIGKHKLFISKYK